MEEKLIDAIIFATQAHDGQRRKYTDEPYICHPLRVLKLAQKYVTIADKEYNTGIMCAAILHDTIEDTKVNYEDVSRRFGIFTASLVRELTNVYTKSDFPNMNREKRQNAEHVRLGNCSISAKELKLCDRYDNILSRPKQKDGFMEKYKRETEDLLQQLGIKHPLVEMIRGELCRM